MSDILLKNMRGQFVLLHKVENKEFFSCEPNDDPTSGRHFKMVTHVGSTEKELIEEFNKKGFLQ